MNFVSPSKLNLKKTNNVDLDLTGSPLKDDCEVEAIGDVSLDLNLITQNAWKPEEEYHKGIAADKARSIMTMEDFQKGSAAAEAIGSVWFLCNAADVPKTLLLQYEFARNKNITGIVNYMGVIASHSVTTESLLQQHFALVGKEARVETQIENNYHIKSNISIKCSWSTVSSIPCLIDLRTCDVVLKQTFRFGDCSSSTLDFVNQLRILMAIRDEIISYKQSENSDLAKEPVYSCGM